MRQSISTSAAQTAVTVAVDVSAKVYEGVDQLGPNNRIKSVEALWKYCQCHVDLPITLLEHPASSVNHSVQSFYLKHPDRFEIVILRDLNRCWERFAVCKELFHVLLDDPSNRNRDLASHVDQIFALDFSDDQNEPRAENEIAAEIAAIEYLFPMRERMRIQCGRPPAPIDVAREFLIPQTYVEKYLGPRTMSLLAKLNYEKVGGSQF